MKIGLIKERKIRENRVGLTPVGVAQLSARGHRVAVEHGAGLGSGFSDDDYQQAGARLVDTAEAWDNELVIKVKEPIETEYGYLRQQMVFTYFHLAGAPRQLTETLLANQTTALAYETLEDDHGRLPLLMPMSAIAGNMAVQMGGHFLAKHHGGKGVLLGSVLGQRHGRVLIIGSGTVGSHAARTAIGLGAEVIVGDVRLENALRLRREISSDIECFVATAEAIADHIRQADLVVGAVLSHGAKADKVISEAMVASMQSGSVIVDVSIDQGGCVATAHATNHADPVFVQHGVLHYCVSNMPGAYPRTATMALTNATLPYALQLADHGLDAFRHDPALAKAVNTHQGYLACQAVAETFSLQPRYRRFA